MIKFHLALSKTITEGLFAVAIWVKMDWKPCHCVPSYRKVAVVEVDYKSTMAKNKIKSDSLKLFLKYIYNLILTEIKIWELSSETVDKNIL